MGITFGRRQGSGTSEVGIYKKKESKIFRLFLFLVDSVFSFFLESYFFLVPKCVFFLLFLSLL